MSGTVTNDGPARRTGGRARRSTRRRSADSAPTRRYQALFYAIIFLIIYGSLYPFNFSLSDPNLLGVKATLDFWRIQTSRGDILGNLALFVPFGSAGMLALSPHRSRALRLVLLLILGFALAAGVQVLQIFLPTRTASAIDVFWNLCGCALGALMLWPRQVRDQMLSLAGISFAVAPAGLLGCWLATELIPFVPSIDFQSFKDSLKPLVAVPDILSVDFLGAAVSSSAAIFLADRAWPGRVRTAWLVCGAAGLVLAKVVIVQNTVTAPFAAGIVTALLLSPLVLRERQNIASLLAAALAVYMATGALEPFTLRSEPQSFSWIPFSGSLSGSMMVNAKAICAKVFLLGTLLYCLKAAGVRQAVAVVLTALLALLLEGAQLWVGEHTPEITDPLLVLFLGLVMMRLDERVPVARGAGERESAGEVQPAAPRQSARSTEGGGRRRRAAALTAADWRAGIFSRGILLALAACVLAALAMNVMLGLPQIPYNVRDLFGGDNAWWRLFVFALAGLSIGAGGAMAGRIVAERQRVFLILPGSVLAACLVTYLLLLVSVTAESLGDITGSANTYWFVMNRDMGGTPGVWLYQAIGARWPIDMAEHFVRFVALFGQAVLWIAILSAVYFRFVNRTGSEAVARYRDGAARAVLCLLAATPWLIVLNLIAFRFSSTDNLNELFAGHGHILYLLLILLPAAALFAAHALRRPSPRAALAAGVVLLASLPVGWLLFKNGLNPAVEKYGQVFSGVDFLLGPDRVERLPESVLMLRWFLVQSAVIVGLAIGIQAVPAPSVRAQRHPEIEGLYG